jgi:hypothetical protein
MGQRLDRVGQPQPPPERLEQDQQQRADERQRTSAPSAWPSSDAAPFMATVARST